MTVTNDEKTFDSIMTSVFNTKPDDAAPVAAPAPAPEINQQPVAPSVTDGGGAPVPAAAPAPQPTTAAQPRDEAGRFASPPAAPTSSAPPPAAPVVTAPAVDPTILSALERLANTQQTTSQLLQQMQAAAAPKPAPVVEDRPPTLDEALSDFRPPARKAGENDVQYALREQADAMDHVRQKDREYAIRQAKAEAQSQITAFRNEMSQQQQMAQAAQNYTTMLNGTVARAGYKGDSAQGQLARAYVDRTLTALHQAGITAQWNEQAWHAAAAHFTQEFSRVMPAVPVPAPGQQPQLTVVPGGAAPAPVVAGPPISAGGSSSPVPGAPPNKNAKKPSSFDEAIKNVFDEMQVQKGA